MPERKKSNRLVVVHSGGRVLGRWTTQEDSIDVLVQDTATGMVLAQIALPGQADVELQADAMDLVPVGEGGDDFTMPLPEDADPPTIVAKGLELLDETVAGESAFPGLFAKPSEQRERGMVSGRLRGDDLTMPFPELTETSALPSGDDVELFEDGPTISGHTKGNQKGTKITGEVWVRKGREWKPAGRFGPGQRVNGWNGRICLTPTGRVEVSTQKSASATVILPDGQSHEVTPGNSPKEYALGVSVMVRSGEHGMYIRTDTG